MKNIKSIVVLAVGILVQSCSPAYYAPPTQVVPLISNKGELSVSGGLAALESFSVNSGHFDIAYGYNDYLAIKLNGDIMNENFEDARYGGKYLELGTGCYKELSKNIVLETYGICGIGSVMNKFPELVEKYDIVNGDVSAKYFTLGVQPNIGFKSDHFSAAVSVRMFHLNYYAIEGDLIYSDVNQADYWSDSDSNFMIEPAFTIRGGFKNLKLFAQIAKSYNLSNPDFRQIDNVITIGVNLNLQTNKK